MKMYTETSDDMTANANQVLHQFIKTMFKEKVIDQDKKEEMEQYSIVLAEKGFFGSFWDKLWGNEDSKVRIFVVKMLN